MPDLLIELFSEEIPARMQGKAAEDLKKIVTNGLVDAGLTYASAGVFSTPRRLTLSIDGLLSESPTTREERKGPRVDAPEKAIEGFLRGAGLTRDQLTEREEKKGKVFFAVIEKPGRPAADIIAEVLEGAIRNFPWPKSMRWGTGSLRWVRPLHSILCILTDETGTTVVPMDVDGIPSGGTTEGHRFMGNGRFAVSGFDDYASKLKAAKVVLDPQERADHIWADATNQAFAQGLEVVEDAGLLREVAGLVEWPVVLMGDIAEDFLGLPPEVLQTSMKEHQKFFSVRNPKTDRIEKFVTVANRETRDNGATILAGNQKVLFARLSDAKFFWENDIRVAEAGAQAWIDSLQNVTFHNKLGTQADRIERIASLAREIAPSVGADADVAEAAARFAKADLSSEMVYEFPELQGLMGRYYAGPAGHPLEVANAALEHYSPLGPSDDVPTAPVSVAVALADKLDLLTGFWAIDEKPTGSKDPFALRRAALGVIRLVLENGARVELRSLIELSFTSLFMSLAGTWKMGSLRANYQLDDNMNILLDEEGNAILASDTRFIYRISNFETILEEWKNGCLVRRDDCRFLADIVDRGDLEFEIDAEETIFDKRLHTIVNPNLIDSLLSFFHDRLKVYLKDQGIRHDVIDACLAMPGNDDIALLVKRAQALSEFLKTDDGENLLQGFKRANNILSQAEVKDGVEYSYGGDVKFAETDEERALFAALDQAGGAISPAIEAEDFAAAMSGMAALRAPIDAFFEAVQVNSDKDIVRRNRLNLLSSIRTICGSVADLTKIEG
ncbi:glycine--tRNA ligase subunit beta [Cochlodiniinecator piscidefendens]|uniref:glycine--tRNA ligase subunit beta n=1 Tax=Cochlodiniinecator piscidefendens TaxID=2715756 RepID=UPI00140BB9BB|nr:glycine--tRNA ligase subunit beta [Cochlodiniinecator piscidefendens]